MYVCLDCKFNFEFAEKILDKHGLKNPPYESIYVCPACKSKNYIKKKISYCRYCGTKLKKGNVLYCSADCKKKGEKVWSKEKSKKEHILNSPIYKRVREIDAYNKKHKTKYSYGQYTALVRKGK